MGKKQATHSAISYAMGDNGREVKQLTVGGDTMSIPEWADRIGLSASCLYGRISRGMTPDEIVDPERKGGWETRLGKNTRRVVGPGYVWTDEDHPVAVKVELGPDDRTRKILTTVKTILKAPLDADERIAIAELLLERF